MYNALSIDSDDSGALTALWRRCPDALVALYATGLSESIAEDVDLAPAAQKCNEREFESLLRRFDIEVLIESLNEETVSPALKAGIAAQARTAARNCSRPPS